MLVIGAAVPRRAGCQCWRGLLQGVDAGDRSCSWLVTLHWCVPPHALFVRVGCVEELTLVPGQPASETSWSCEWVFMLVDPTWTHRSPVMTSRTWTSRQRRDWSTAD